MRVGWAVFFAVLREHVEHCFAESGLQALQHRFAGWMADDQAEQVVVVRLAAEDTKFAWRERLEGEGATYRSELPKEFRPSHSCRIGIRRVHRSNGGHIDHHGVIPSWGRSVCAQRFR